MVVFMHSSTQARRQVLSTRNDVRGTDTGRARSVRFASLAPALADAGAAARLDVDDLHEPGASLSTTATMLIEILFVLVAVTAFARVICLAFRGLVAHEAHALFELTLVEPDAARCRTDI